MLSLLLRALCVAFFGASLIASAASSADQAFAAFNKTRNEPAPADVASDPEALRAWAARRVDRAHDEGLKFMQQYPTDPRRWDVLVQLRFINAADRPILADGRVVPPEEIARAEAWALQFAGMLEQLLDSRDASHKARAEATRYWVMIQTTRVLRDPQLAPDLVPRIRAREQALFKEQPQSGTLGVTYHYVSMMLEAENPATNAAFIEEILARHPALGFPDEYIRKRFQGRQRMVAAMAGDVAFLWERLQEFDREAADPRRFKGQVVLIAVLPVGWDVHTRRLEALQAAHANDGLAIIQIVERNRSPSAPPELQDPAAMRAFVRKKGWAWTVLWDPNSHIDAFSDLWALNSAPAYIVLNREGRVVAHHEWVERMEEHVSRELKR